MNKIGIRGHDIGKMSATELAKKIKDFGFDGVQLVFKKALTTKVDFSDIHEIKSAFIGLDIPLLGAYFNPIQPNLEERNESISYFKENLKIAQSLGASFVGSETGFLIDSSSTNIEAIHNEATLSQVTEVFRDLVLTAEKYNSFVAIEGAYAHVAYDPFSIKYIVDQINSPHLKVIVDLYNFLNINNYQDRMEIFETSLSLLKNDIVIFHLKDFIVENGKLKQVGLGQGLMDYETIIHRIYETNPDAYLILEGVTGLDIGPSLSLIKKLIERK